MKRENMSGGYTTSGVVSRRKGKRQFPGSPRGGTIYPRAFARERSYPSAPSGRYPIFLAVGEGGAISSRIAPKTGRYRLPPRRFEIAVRDLNRWLFRPVRPGMSELSPRAPLTAMNMPSTCPRLGGPGLVIPPYFSGATPHAQSASKAPVAHRPSGLAGSPTVGRDRAGRIALPVPILPLPRRAEFVQRDVG